MVWAPLPFSSPPLTGDEDGARLPPSLTVDVAGVGAAAVAAYAAAAALLVVDEWRHGDAQGQALLGLGPRLGLQEGSRERGAGRVGRMAMAT